MTTQTASLLDAARALAPAIAAASDEIERERRLPGPLVEAMADAGLFRMLVPASLGGSEADLVTVSEVIEAVARADGSTAWCLGQAVGSAAVAAFMDREAARTIFGDPRAVIAWGPSMGTAVLTDAGYRLSGRWAFGSGCHHATWLGGSARVVHEDGTPCLRDGRPEIRRFLFPASKAEFIDVWQVSGLRGTGSDNYAVQDLLVPAAFSVLGNATGLPMPEMPHEPGIPYAFPLTLLYGITFASVALGLARGTLDAFAELAGAKTGRGGAGLLREDAVVQVQIARAEAEVRSSRAFLHQAVRDASATAATSGSVPLEPRVLVRLAATHAIHASAQAVDTAYHAAGATAIFAGNPFERRFRDVHAVTQQGQGNQLHFKTTGQFFLGLNPDASAL